jgi:hypothetical protein
MVCVELTSEQIELFFDRVKIEQKQNAENAATFEDNLRNRNSTNLITSEVHRNGHLSFLFLTLARPKSLPHKYPPKAPHVKLCLFSKN